jgi:hypothetical protein
MINWLKTIIKIEKNALKKTLSKVLKKPEKVKTSK